MAVELAKWKRDHANNPYVLISDGQKLQLMFVSRVNRPCSRNDLKKAMTRAVKKANENGAKLKTLSFYSLRHHFASILIHRMNQGRLSDLEIAKIMGHKDTTITRKVYAKYIKAESTYEPDQVFTENPVVIQQPLAEIEPASELLN